MLNDRDTMLQVSLKAAATAAAFGENVLEFGGNARDRQEITTTTENEKLQAAGSKGTCMSRGYFPVPGLYRGYVQTKMLMGVASPIVVRQNSIKAPLLENRFLFAVCPARMENADTLKCDDDR